MSEQQTIYVFKIFTRSEPRYHAHCPALMYLSADRNGHCTFSLKWRIQHRKIKMFQAIAFHRQNLMSTEPILKNCHAGMYSTKIGATACRSKYCTIHKKQDTLHRNQSKGFRTARSTRSSNIRAPTAPTRSNRRLHNWGGKRAHQNLHNFKNLTSSNTGCPDNMIYQSILR